MKGAGLLYTWVRQQGLRRTVIDAVGQLAWSRRRVYVFYTSLAVPEHPPVADGLEFRVVSPSDLALLDVFTHPLPRGGLRAWFASGGWIFLCLDGGRPVAFNCLSRFVPARLPIQLEPGQVWADEAFVEPPYRRRHVIRRLWEFRSWVLGQWGYTEAVGSVDERNYPSLEAVCGAGNIRAVQRVTRRYVLGFRTVHVEPDARARLEARLREARRA